MQRTGTGLLSAWRALPHQAVAACSRRQERLLIHCCQHPLGLDKLEDFLFRLALGVEISVHGRHTGEGVKDRAAGMFILPQLWVR